ncbi:histidine phosphatase family protein [Lysinibacillus sphaericus]|uniref:histidine phosphatase family protein n=1 Tax=Lysinibacillus sphaericus TaxID=1421 RepID=UPI003F78FA0F
MEKALLGLLRVGGFILYARHAQATVGNDQPYFNFENCYTQRNLSVLGQSEAVYYGQMLRYLQVPISPPIVASPFCRTIETAQLAFPNVNVQTDPFWYDIFKLGGNISTSEQQRILTKLRSVLAMEPPQGTNKVIIAHSFPKGIGLGKVSNLGTVIVKPRGHGHGYEIVKQISLADLADLGSSELT